ncbi:Pentatricopeptide repeat-containing protein [Nymphaea thermarum]|nr:Pentatricopeptide repeat-containing protein [Nymphaea thermarum]
MSLANSDEYAISDTLNVSARLKLFGNGRQIHALCIKRGFYRFIVLTTALMDLYIKCERLANGQKLFKEMPERDVVSWTSLIVGHVQHGQHAKSLTLFSRMMQEGVKPNCHSFSATLSGCSGLQALRQGQQIHAQLVAAGMPANSVVENSLLHLYVKCFAMDAATKLFNRIPDRSLVAWNEMISAHVECGLPEEGLKLMHRMNSSDVKPDDFTFAICIRACSRLTSINQGQQFHGSIIRNGLESDLVISNALVDMYSKCGCLASAKQIFDLAPVKDKILWTAMIAAYGKFGQVKAAITMFEQMQELNAQPDEITYIALLSACCHGGLVREGWHYFRSMYQKHSVSPQQEHYACMVDLLCRSERVLEAYDFIKSMPTKPGATVWGAFLGYCRLHGDIELSRPAVMQLLKLDPQNHSNYIAMSNVYAAAGAWNEMLEIRGRMKNDNVKKEPGCSWIEVKGSVHAFLAAKTSHPQIGEILSTLSSLNIYVKGNSYEAYRGKTSKNSRPGCSESDTM